MEPEKSTTHLLNSNGNQSDIVSNTDLKPAILWRYTSTKLVFYCCLFRVVNAWLVDTQFDPDEYWQTLEVAHCVVFKTCDDRTWEWKSNHPIRSYVSILPTALLYQCLKLCRMDTPLLVRKGPSILHSLLFAAPTDISTYIMANLLFYNTNKQQQQQQRNTGIATWSLLCSLTSWFHGYCLVRTYTNGIECFMICLVTTCLLLGHHTNQSTTNFVSVNYCTKAAFVLAGICVAGVRFTSLAAFVPIGIIFFTCNKYLHRKLITFMLFIFYCSLYGILGLFCCILVDRYFYGFWTIVCVNNFYTNIVQNYGSLYGTHPFHWYCSVGLPVICSTTMTLVIPFLIGQEAFFSSPTQKRHCYDQGIVNLLWFIIITYVAIHSLSAHKEFRFLLPVMPFICLLSGYLINKHIQNYKSHKQKQRFYLIFTFLVMVNLCIWFYLARFHQRAPIQVNKLIVTQLQKQSQKFNISTIHYLMGCHSTPIYSHLHAFTDKDSATRIKIRTLDCSPTCRLLEKQNPKQTPICESNLFLQNPIGFLQATYSLHIEHTHRNSWPLSSSNRTLMDEDYCEVDTCHTNNATSTNNLVVTSGSDRPDFIAVYEKEALVTHDILTNEMRMKLIDKIPNELKHIQLIKKKKEEGHILSKFLPFIQIKLDYMYLYQKENMMDE